MSDVALCGWRVASAIALPELPGWRGDGAVDIRITIGAVPAALARTVRDRPDVRVSMSAGQVLLHVAGVAGYLVQDGRCVTVAPVAPGDSPDVRLYLLGAVSGYLCHQRGLLPVHAAAVEVDGRAVLFAGRSGAGKSTLAAAFRRRGYRLLSDDLSPIDAGGDAAMVLPGLARIRLRPDSARAMGWPGDLAQLGKMIRPAGCDPAWRLPAAAIFHLGDGRDMRLERLRGAAAIQALARQVYRRRAFSAIVGETIGMQRITATAERIALHYAFDRVRDYAALDDQIELIVATVRESAAAAG